MSRATTPRRATRELTFEQYLATPVTSKRLEVIDGVIVMSPTPTFWHQQVLGTVVLRLDTFATSLNLGSGFVAPLDVLIRKEPKLRTRQPDLIFLGTAKHAGLDLKKTNVLEIAPDLVGEIRSPGHRPKAWAEKLADYASIGLVEVWLIDTDKETVEILNLADGEYARAGLFAGPDVIVSAIFPGLGMPASALFA